MSEGGVGVWAAVIAAVVVGLPLAVVLVVAALRGSGPENDESPGP